MQNHQDEINALKIRCFDLQRERDNCVSMINEIMAIVKQKIGKEAEEHSMNLGQMLSLLSYVPDNAAQEPAKKAAKKGK